MEEVTSNMTLAVIMYYLQTYLGGILKYFHGNEKLIWVSFSGRNRAVGDQIAGKNLSTFESVYHRKQVHFHTFKEAIMGDPSNRFASRI